MSSRSLGPVSNAVWHFDLSAPISPGVRTVASKPLGYVQQERVPDMASAFLYRDRLSETGVLVCLCDPLRPPSRQRIVQTVT